MDLRNAVLSHMAIEPVKPKVRVKPVENTLRIMSYNVHGCLGMDGAVSPERIARVIARHHPDVVALQELDYGRRRSKGVDQTSKIAAYLEMSYHFHPVIFHQEGSYGNAILSRYPLNVVKMIELPRQESIKNSESRGALPGRPCARRKSVTSWTSSSLTPSAARIPPILLAAIDIPTPLEQTRIPRSHSPEATFVPTAAA